MVGRPERSDAEGNKRARLESDKSDEVTEKTRQGDSRRKDNAAPLSKKARTDAAEEDPIEDDSEDDNNAFMRFKRPGAVVVVRKKPTAPPASAKGGRPTRVAAAAANGRSAGSKPGVGRAGNREQELRRSGRAASAAAQQRIRNRPDDDSFLDDDEEGSDSGDEQPKQQQRARRGKIVQSESEAEDSHDGDGGEGEEEDVEMVDGSSSGSDSDLVDDEDVETRRRPARGAAPRPSARPTRASARSRQPVIDEESDEVEEEDEEEEEVAAKRSSRVARASHRRPTRAAARGAAGRRAAGQDESSRDDDGEEEEEEEGSGAEEEEDGDADSDVEVVGVKEASGEGEDEEEESEEEDEEDHASEEEESGRSRPRRAAAAAAAKRVSRQQKEEARGGDRRRGAERAAKGANPDGKKQQQLQVQKGAAAGGKEPATAKLKKDKGPTEPVERILSYDADTGLYHIKLEGVSYRRTARVTQAFLEAKKPALLRTFMRSLESRDASGPSDGIYPDWTQVDRVISHRKVSRGSRGPGVQYLVKWRDLEYSDATWEWQEELQQDRDKAAIEAYKRFDAPRGKEGGSGRNAPSLRALRTPDWELPTFCSGRKLREYQEVSVRWMVNNMVNSRNCILGDEMGLGKTAQSISVLQTLRQVGGVEGPFLVVAPLSTLPHWQREIQTWTDMNVVLFAGSAADRDLIEEYEFYRSGAGSKRAREVKFHVLLASYDTLLKERSRMRSFSWSAAVFDEAHRLKGLHSATRQAVEEMDIGWKLLLTGTPIQNNMLELFSILNLLDPEEYPSQEDFVERFGGSPGGPPPTVEQIKQLQEALAPVLLRRMKEDVEELPQKEEVVIWVELTSLQRQYYRAVYEGQIGALLGGPGVKSLPGMRNLAMELRKLCCHPVLCDGLEEDLGAKLAAQREAHAAGEGAAGGYTPFPGSPELELLVRGSGKMLLLHKLLPKLRGEGRRVLIFSQFVIMLNVLEDYCRAAGWPVERLDGSITGRARQQAIDRFCATDTPEDESSAPFVFLLSTRAGGQGITLTTADTVIIYDSDWNPQNDLQAMARCHRIGQTKEVTVYRLISRDTYEMALFSSASRKYGLDEAILGFSAGSDPEADSSRIAALLRHGAHGLLGDTEAGQRQGEAFASEDIGHILAQRTEKRQIGSRAGNTFSVATFVVDEDPTGADAAPAKGGKDAQADAEYWRALMPEAVAAHEAKAAEGPVVLGPRQRRKVCYALDKMDKELEKHLNSSDEDSGNGKGGKGSKGSKEDGKENNADGERGGAADGAAGAGERPAKRRKKKAKEDKDAEGATDPAAGEAAEGAGKDAEGATKEPKQKGPRGRQLRPAWSKPEVKALEDRLLGLGAGRLADLHATMHPTKRSPEEVVEAGAALWELMQLAERLVGDREVDTVKARAEELRAKLAAAAAGTGAGTAAGAKEEEKKVEAGEKKEAAGEGEKKEQEEEGGEGKEEGEKKGGEGKDKEKDRPLDAYEQKLATAAELLPESIRAALCSSAAVRRLMRDSRSAIRHMRMMQELQDIMKPQPAPAPQPAAEAKAAGEDGSAAAPAAAPASASPAAGGVNAPAPALRVGPVPITGNLPSWWTRADDEALLMAAVQVGYTPGVPRRTVEHALTAPDLGLSAKVRLLAPPPQQDQEQQPGQGTTAEAGATAMEVDAKPAAEQPQQEQAAAAAGDGAKGGQAEAMDVDGAKPQADGDQQQQEQQHDGQQGQQVDGQAKDGSAAADKDTKEEAAQAAGGATAAAATAAVQPKANKDSHEFTPDEYKALVKELSRRLSTLVRVTVDFRRRPHTARPVAAPKPAPAAKPPVPTTAAPSPAAGNTSAAKPTTVSPTARPGSGAPSSAAAAGEKPAAATGGKASAPVAGSSAAANGKAKDSSDAKAPAATAAAAPGTGSAPSAAGNGAATGAAAPKPAGPAQGQGGAGGQPQHGAGKAAPKERPGSGKPGMKQSVLPFGRLPLAKSNPNVSALVNSMSPPGTGCGKAKAAGKGGDKGVASPRPADVPEEQPIGSPHCPIEVD